MRRHACALALSGLLAMPAHAFTTCHGVTIDDPSRQLMPCGDKPNCVSTEHAATGRRLEAPTGIPLARMREAIAAEPRSQIVAEGEQWLIARFSSRLFGFIHEAHFIARPDGTLAMRSGACSGYWDMGVNQRRLERLLERARED